MDIKNVITINDFNYAQGGASRVAIDTANALDNKGLTSVFVSAVSNDKECSLNSTVIQYKYNGKEFLKYKNKFKGMLDGLKCRKFGQFIAEVLSNYSPNDTVVHIHGWTKACSSVVFRICQERGFKVFLTCHDYFSVCPNGALLNYQTNKCCNLKCCSIQCLCTSCDSRNMLFKLYRYIREHQYYRDINLEVINSIFVSTLQKKLISDQRNIKNAIVINSPVVEVNSSSEEKKNFDFVYIGRDSGEKGIDLYIDLARRMPDHSFLIVGDYKRKKTDNVRVTGWVNEQEVEKYLKQSRFFVLPSLLPEPMSLVAVKAMALGIPCLISTNTGAAEYVNRDNGVLFKQGDINDMEEKAHILFTIQATKNDGLLVSFDSYIEKVLNYYASCK